MLSSYIDYFARICKKVKTILQLRAKKSGDPALDDGEPTADGEGFFADAEARGRLPSFVFALMDFADELLNEREGEFILLGDLFGGEAFFDIVDQHSIDGGVGG